MAEPLETESTMTEERYLKPESNARVDLDGPGGVRPHRDSREERGRNSEFRPKVEDRHGLNPRRYGHPVHRILAGPIHQSSKRLETSMD